MWKEVVLTKKKVKILKIFRMTFLEKLRNYLKEMNLTKQFILFEKILRKETLGGSKDSTSASLTNKPREAETRQQCCQLLKKYTEYWEMTLWKGML